MKTNIRIDIDPQEVYDALMVWDKRKFLINNISDLKDEDLKRELVYRGYNTEKVIHNS